MTDLSPLRAQQMQNPYVTTEEPPTSKTTPSTSMATVPMTSSPPQGQQPEYIHWEIGYEILLDAATDAKAVAVARIQSPVFQWPNFIEDTNIHYVWRYTQPPTPTQLHHAEKQNLAMPIEDWTLEFFPRNQ